MKRLCFLAVLMVLSQSAQAGSSISFTVGGHRIQIDASRYCRSTSCASVSISGIYQSRRQRDRFEDDDRDVPAPAKAAPPPLPAPPAVAAPPGNLPAQTVIAVAPPAVYKPAATAAAVIAPPPVPIQQAAIPRPPAPPPPAPHPIAQPAEATRPAPVAVPEVGRVSHEVEDEADMPIGDWQTQGRGLVRIGRCGNALCGYVLNSSDNTKGEAVLINMKRKADRQWTGSIYSHDSGDTYYGTMDIKGPNTLRVEACALGRFYCSGSNWSRPADPAQNLMTSTQVSVEPRS